MHTIIVRESVDSLCRDGVDVCNDLGMAEALYISLSLYTCKYVYIPLPPPRSQSEESSQSEGSSFYKFTLYLTIPLWNFVIVAFPLYLFLVVHTFMSQCFISRWRNNAGNCALAIVSSQ